MSIIASRRVADSHEQDTIEWTNDTGSATVNNQLVFVAAGTNKGIVGLSSGAIANGAAGTLIIKQIVELPKAACAMSLGGVAQAATDSTSLTMGGTASGLYAVGQIREPLGTAASYVKVDLNYGPSAFYVW